MSIEKQIKRYYEIDLFRFLAAMGVVLFHYTFRGWASGGYSPIVFPRLGQVFKYGYLGVDLFFMISGFVILFSIQNKTFKEFLVSRISRLYPAYWCCVVITFLMTLLIGDGHFQATWLQFWANLTMMHWIVHINSIDGVYWALIVELKFYFLIAVVLLLKQWKSMNFLLFMWFIISLVLLPIMNKQISYARFFFIPEYSFYFISGALFYLMVERPVSCMKLVFLIGCYAGSIWQAVTHTLNLMNRCQTGFNLWIVVGVITSYYLVFALVITNRMGFLRKKSFLFFGGITYSLFLVHQNVGYMLFWKFNTYGNRYLILGMTIGFMIVLSSIIYLRIEMGAARQLKTFMMVISDRLRFKLDRRV